MMFACIYIFYFKNNAEYFVYRGVSPIFLKFSIIHFMKEPELDHIPLHHGPLYLIIKEDFIKI